MGTRPIANRFLKIKLHTETIILRDRADLDADSHVLKTRAPIARQHRRDHHVRHRSSREVIIYLANAGVLVEIRVFFVKLVWVACAITSLRPVCDVQSEINGFAQGVFSGPFVRGARGESSAGEYPGEKYCAYDRSAYGQR